jgi:hypothetical protein
MSFGALSSAGAYRAAGTIEFTMADQQELSLGDQLKEIGAQLDWVRGYL